MSIPSRSNSVDRWCFSSAGKTVEYFPPRQSLDNGIDWLRAVPKKSSYDCFPKASEEWRRISSITLMRVCGEGSYDSMSALKAEIHMSDDIVAIETAVKTYLDGLYEGDAQKLAAVFHPTSALTWEQEGALTPLPRDEWLKLVRDRPSPKAKGLARHDEILQIDQSSPTTAFVKLKCAIPPRFFTDYLCFLKVEGRWQIAQKVFSTEIR